MPAIAPPGILLLCFASAGATEGAFVEEVEEVDTDVEDCMVEEE